MRPQAPGAERGVRTHCRGGGAGAGIWMSGPGLQVHPQPSLSSRPCVGLPDLRPPLMAWGLSSSQRAAPGKRIGAGLRLCSLGNTAASPSRNARRALPGGPGGKCVPAASWHCRLCSRLHLHANDSKAFRQIMFALGIQLSGENSCCQVLRGILGACFQISGSLVSPHCLHRFPVEASD